MINHVISELAKLHARLKSDLILNSAVPKQIMEALPRNLDGGVLCTTLGTDPLDDLALLKPQERRQLAHWLNRLWEGQPLSQLPALKQLSLLWTTKVESLGHLARWREFHAGTTPVPLLVVSSVADRWGEPGARIPHEAQWERLMDDLFDRRCEAEETVLQLDEESRQPLWDFELHLRRNLHTMPREFRPHLAWLPGLAPRLALTLHLVERKNGDSISLDTAIRAVKIARFFAGKHLQATMSALPFPVPQSPLTPLCQLTSPTPKQ